MKFLIDLLPVILFFAAYSLTRDIYLATGVAIIVTAGQVGWAWLRHRKVDTLQWISLALIVLLGGATLLFHDKAFIMIKPTALYWIMGIGLLLSHKLFGKNPLKSLMEKQITLPEPVWNKLTYAWTLFFIAMGGLNLFVAFQFSEAVWVNFKLFGGMGLMLLFVIGQSVYLAKYLGDKN